MAEVRATKQDLNRISEETSQRLRSAESAAAQFASGELLPDFIQQELREAIERAEEEYQPRLRELRSDRERLKMLSATTVQSNPYIVQNELNHRKIGIKHTSDRHENQRLLNQAWQRALGDIRKELQQINDELNPVEQEVEQRVAEVRARCASFYLGRRDELLAGAKGAV